jgi:hypothetical protein
MADEKSPLERIIEAAVFAPLGIAAMIREELPKLVDRGHQEANMAKMMGQFAVTMGRQEVEKRLKQVAERPAQSASRPAATPAAPAATRAPATETTAPPTAPTPEPAASAPAPAPTASGNGTAVTVHDAQSLAIPGYDSLSASQVVQRLAGLNPAELAAIGAYEAAGRGRRTILNRVAQLRDA